LKPILIGKQLQTSLSQASENQMVLILLGVSLFFHLIVLVVDTSMLSNPSKPLFQEWEIEASLISEDTLSSSKDSALPDAKEAEEAKVAKNILPQLPKKFAIKEKSSPEGVGDGEVVKKDDKPKEKSTDTLETKNKPDEANKIAKKEALERLAKERLRLEKKFAKKNQAIKSSSLARLKQQKDLENKLSSGALGLGKAENKYIGKLKIGIGRCYDIPSAYNFANADIQTKIGIVVSKKGELIKSRIVRPSGDLAFDNVVYKAIQDCVSLPIPPSSLANKEIHLNFNPKSF